MLFKYQKSNLDKTNAQQSSSTEDEHCYNINKLTEKRRIAKKFTHLVGFKVQTALDRNLLKGLFFKNPGKNPRPNHVNTTQIIPSLRNIQLLNDDDTQENVLDQSTNHFQS